MIASISKPKPPKGRSYVLQTSLLEAALAEAHVDIHVDLVYLVPYFGSNWILSAHYWAPRPRFPFPRVYVQAGVVASERRAAAKSFLIEQVLPAFVRWVAPLSRLPENAPRRFDNLIFEATFDPPVIRSS